MLAKAGQVEWSIFTRMIMSALSQVSILLMSPLGPALAAGCSTHLAANTSTASRDRREHDGGECVIVRQRDREDTALGAQRV